MNKLAIILVSLSVIASISCSKEEVLDQPIHQQISEYQPFTQEETTLIMSGDTNVPMRVLLTTNREDSLFLRQKSMDVEPDFNNPVLIRLIKRLYYTMISDGGVGIAAPQVGIHRNLFWFKRFDVLPNKPFQVAINPKINFYSQRKVNFIGDGCLSVPDISGKTERFSSIMVEYTLDNGVVEKNILEGYSSVSFTSVCFQHEFDHLQGVLFVDRLVAK